MSLSGNLGFVSIDEVLRLLSRSKQQGAIDVRGEGFSGRVFVGTSGVDLATTSDDNSLRRHLLHSGLVDEVYIASIEAGDASLAKFAEENGDSIIELLREMTVESLYQIGRHGEDFEVFEGQSTAFASPDPFELEAVLADAAQRADDWESVSQAVPDLGVKILFERDLGDRDEIKVAADAWKVLSEIGSGSSVEEIAEKLGTTQFWTARVAGHLLDDSLVALTGGEDKESPVEADEPVAASNGAGEVSWDKAEWEQKSAEWGSDVKTPAGASEADVDPNQSWWAEPSDDGDSQTADSDAEPVAASDEDKSDKSLFGKFAPGGSDDAEDSEESLIPTLETPETTEIEEDTEAFLEKVFSELDSADEDDDGDAGYGLLGRKRMGAGQDSATDA